MDKQYKLLNERFFFLAALLIFCLAMAFVNNIPDYDLWARLIVGKHFLEAGVIPKADFLSYTPTHPWFDHEWGASIVYYAALKYFGEIGLVILKGTMIFGILFFVNKIVSLRSTKVTSPDNILFYVVSFLAFYPVLAATIRCHLFTFLFFTIWLYLLEKVRKGERKWLFYFPFMMIFWSNIHGGCVSGLGLIGLYLIGEYLNKKPVKDYLISFILTGLSMFINPYGPQYVMFLAQATTMERPLITEWFGTFSKFYALQYIKFKLFFFVMLFAPIINTIKSGFDYKKIDKTKVLVVLFTAILAVKHIKHQPFFVIAAASFLYDDFYLFFNKITSSIKNKLNIKSEETVLKIKQTKEFVVYSLILFVSLFTISTIDKTIKISQKKYPIYEVEFVKMNKLKGNVFVNFHYGSYLAYKLYPENKIVMDGRYEEVYDDELLKEMKDFHLAKVKNWDDIIKKYQTDVIILEKIYPAFKKVAEDETWTMIFESKDFGVFVPTGKVQKHYLYPPAKDEFYDKTKFETPIQFERQDNFLTKPL